MTESSTKKSFTIYKESKTISESIIHYGVGVPVFVGAVLVFTTWNRLHSMKNWFCRHSDDELPIQEVVEDVAEVVGKEII